jgi:hypothetical protein
LKTRQQFLTSRNDHQKILLWFAEKHVHVIINNVPVMSIVNIFSKLLSQIPVSVLKRTFARIAKKYEIFPHFPLRAQTLAPSRLVTKRAEELKDRARATLQDEALLASDEHEV